jgi:hypothetical protein
MLFIDKRLRTKVFTSLVLISPRTANRNEKTLKRKGRQREGKGKAKGWQKEGKGKAKKDKGNF